ncbi:MAG: glutamate N-acetyltransferase / amino-acid N-acetyltransferase [Candidatus Methanomethylophilaceae archaeon]|nr:glutamate N-acetyltransferase / amino-acid N-acetyltransferase [Candidatus Methanomethylophilaceae archaeon]MDI3542053.1 glutamate N-acetyltransferase / amino-acid N-acetyltransferase [Candidatus Methanomethylophilaceae archaeon]HIJ00858.1 bifunctional glutamate N-acetyltransferase/amino-acid acetyltransferase ArgJ [Candidatus Methanomethylophilaceae archaeon]
MIEKIEGGITAAQGFKAAGVHSGVKYRSLDLGLLTSDVPAKCFIGYTSNKVKAAPIQVMMEANPSELQAFVVNSGNANALTGKRGIEDVYTIRAHAAAALGIDEELVGVISTGLIGRFLDMPKILYGIDRAAKELTYGLEADSDFAEAIMTTDTRKKEAAYRVKLEDGSLITIAGVAKGSGMIAPHLKVLQGTTLSFIVTDAVLTENFKGTWQEILDDTFNMISVDGDQSTNDMSVLLANGLSGSEIADEDPNFIAALRKLMKELAYKVVEDGEGVTKVIEVEVRGAQSKEDAVAAVKSIIRSPLVKTAIFGSDPNYGRIMMALGNSGVDFDIEKVKLTIIGSGIEVPILECGMPVFEDQRSVDIVRMAMEGDTVKIIVTLGDGDYSAVGWGCDLSYDYVKINAEYST